MKPIYALMAVVIGTVSMSCQYRQPLYGVMIHNLGNATIEQANVKYDGFAIWGLPAGTHVIAGGRKAHFPANAPIPEEAEVTWRIGEGELITKRVKVLEKVPKGFLNKDEYIIFRINGDSVTVDFDVR